MKRPSIVLELSGHIIDSLTLAKVIDKVQTRGLDYQINDLNIGRRKHEVSTAFLSLWADRAEDLQRAVIELEAYGAHPVASRPARTRPAPQDGVLPEEGYVRPNPPMQVLIGEDWLAVEREGCDYTVVVEGEHALLRRVADLKAGDLVVLAGDGLRAIPER